MACHEMLEYPDNEDRYKERLQELGQENDPHLPLELIVDPVQVCGHRQLTQFEHFIALMNEIETVGGGFGVPRDFSHNQLGIGFDPQPQMNHIGQTEYAFHLGLQQFLVQGPQTAGQTGCIAGFNHLHAVVYL